MKKVTKGKQNSKIYWNELMEMFLNFKKAEGRAKSTIDGYIKILSILKSRYPDVLDNPVNAVRSHFATLENPNSYNIHFAYIKVFFDWCIREDFLSCTHPLVGLKKRKAVGRIVHIENKTLEELLKLPNKNTFPGLRDYALMLFSIDCGARPGEALQLRKEDFNFPAMLVTIPASIAKTRQPRTIPISYQTIRVSQSLLETHHPNWKNSTVFCSEDGSIYAENSWGQRLKSYSKKLGTKITPYFLRHAAALGMLRAGMSVFALKDMLGHSDLSMTQKYLALTLDDLRREHAKSSLINVVAPKKIRVRNLQ